MKTQLKVTYALLLSCVALAMSASLGAADFMTGKRAYDKGDYATAAREWQTLAEQGDADAQHWLAGLYADGWGVPRDYAQWLRWDWEAARRGQRSAQQAMGWPFTDSDKPYLACTADISEALQQRPADGAAVVSYRQSLPFKITLHNSRPVLESLLVAGIETTQPQPKQPNIEIEIYRIENERRVPVEYRLTSTGGSAGPQYDDAWLESFRGNGIRDESLSMYLRIPPEGSERREYVEQLVAKQASSPAIDPQTLQSFRPLLNTPLLDNLLPNRLGAYEVVCRYQSHRSNFWPGLLIAQTLRFEFVKN